MSDNHARQKDTQLLRTWAVRLSSCLGTLNQLAGSTEQDFLQAGNRLLAITGQAQALGSTAGQFVEISSGQRMLALMQRLESLLQDMSIYLRQAQERNNVSCERLFHVRQSLKKVGEPIEDFRRLTKKLYMFEVLIRIESTYMGGMETEFMNLANDIKALSQQIKDKTKIIATHSSDLCLLLNRNIENIHVNRSALEQSTTTALQGTEASISNLSAVNCRFTEIGRTLSAATTANSAHIGEIVQSLQIHDIFRQQVEHVAEALEWLQTLIDQASEDPMPSDDVLRSVGDTCQLQEAQLRHGSETLYGAVSSVVAHLHEIGCREQELTRELFAGASGDEQSSSAVIEEVEIRLEAVTGLLSTCTATNAGMMAVMGEVASTVTAITAFVADVEEIGSEIIKIALNARIKAAATGQEGAALSAISEEVGQLSNEAVQRTNLITESLTEIQVATNSLTSEAENNDSMLTDHLGAMHREMADILALLKSMNGEMMFLLPRIRQQQQGLADSIIKATGSITVHERCRSLAQTVLEALEAMIREARTLCPANETFEADLQRMAESYTMESERRVHESIAGAGQVQLKQPGRGQTGSSVDQQSEFGENIELF